MTQSLMDVVGGRRRRPFGLLVLAGLLLLKGLLLLLVLGGAFLPDGGPVRRLLSLPIAIALSAADTPVVTAVGVVVAALLLVAAIGLLRGDRRGWLIAMVMTGLFLVAEIWGFSEGQGNHVWMVLDIVTVFYLNQTDVREMVGALRRETSPEAAT